MELVMKYFQYGLMVLGAIVPISTALVRLPFLSKFEGDVSDFNKGLQKFIGSLPTLGKNPNTKKLEEDADERQATAEAIKKAADMQAAEEAEIEEPASE